MKVRPERLDYYRSLGDVVRRARSRTTTCTATTTGEPDRGSPHRSRRLRGGRASSRRPDSYATPRSNAAFTRILALVGLTKYWNLYVLRVAGVPERIGEQRSASEIADVEKRFGFDERVADPDDLARVEATLGPAATQP